MRSFIGWVGGKSQLRKHIIPLIPNDCRRYIEVCGGAGWVLFGKEKVKGQMEVFNDIDGDLINLYRQIKYNCSALQDEIGYCGVMVQGVRRGSGLKPDSLPAPTRRRAG